jgi:hypothetical protein
VVCRRAREKGLQLPTAVTVCPPFICSFAGSESRRELPGEVTESVRDVEVSLGHEPTKGEREAELTFHWAADPARTFRVPLAVKELVRMTPSSVIFGPSDKIMERSICITSDDRPFRIRAVAGQMLLESPVLSAEPKRVQQLTLSLDRARGLEGQLSEIVITTDHPSVGDLKLSVLVLPTKPTK